MPLQLDKHRPSLCLMVVMDVVKAWSLKCIGSHTVGLQSPEVIIFIFVARVACIAGFKVLLHLGFESDAI